MKNTSTSLVRDFLFSGWRIAALLLALGVSTTSCASCSHHDGTPPEGAVGDTTWAIKVYIQADDGRKRFDFPPLQEISAPEAHDNADTVSSPALHEKGIDGGTPIVPTQDDLDSPNTPASWALVWGAAAQCGMRGAATMPVKSWTGGMTATIPPWTNAGSWFIFPAPPASCDAELEYEEDLLCIADKLAEIADTVKPLTWDGVAGLTPPFSSIPRGPWLIPPQAQQDKFIVRDLAIHVLTHIPRLDARRMTAGTASGVCSQLYAATRTPATVTADYSNALFGVSLGALPVYPPPMNAVVSGTPAFDGMIDDRLGFEAHALRASGRLLHDLIRESVFADVAGAEQRSARALDPRKGNEIAWGIADAANGPYNSLAHAARVLHGRWEMGARLPDPKCAGARSLTILTDAYGDDRSARPADLPLTTNGRAMAATLFEHAGLVVPPAILATTSSDQLKAALADQEIGQQALANGVTATELGDQAVAIRAAVQGLNDADLRYAADRAFRTYQLVANSSEVSLMPPSPGGGLKRSIFVSSSLPVGADVIAGGLSRSRLPTDAMARVGGLFEASQCSEERGLLDAVFADDLSDWETATPEARRRQRAMYQDSFAVGQALFRRLVVIREEAAQGGLHPNSEAIARGGYAEIKTWAGGSRVVLRAENDTDVGTPNSIELYLVGLDEATTGVFDPQIPDRFELTLVYGPPWVAECAARLRTDCPENFATDYVKQVSSVAGEDDDYIHRILGTSGPFSLATFDFSVRPPQFNPVYKGSGLAPPTSPIGNEHLYLIGRSDPSLPAKGWVVGALSLQRPDLPTATELTTGFVISPMQRELDTAVFGLGVGPSKPDLGTPTSAKPPTSCLDGVPRDIFVPLENELTSDADPYENSWKHYLTLAQQSAQRADELGQQLVNQEINLEMRREAAGEALAEICGGAPDLSSIAVSVDGSVKMDPADASLTTCMNEPKMDVVFLGDDAAAVQPGPGAVIKTEADATAFLKTSVLLCSGVGHDNALCKKPLLLHDGLHIAPAFVPPDVARECKIVDDVLFSLRADGLNGTKFQSALAQPWAQSNAMNGLAQAIRVKVENDGEWTVRVAGSLVMDSHPTIGVDPQKLWPGCLAAPLNCNFVANPVVRGFNRLYRHCPGGANSDTARESPTLGGCDSAGGVAQAERNSLLWRVEGSVWLIGGLGGHWPDRMFDIPVPAYDSTVAPAIVPQVVGTFYPNQFAPSGPGTFAPLPGSEIPDVTALGSLTTIDPSFQYSPDGARPLWLTSLYGAERDHYHHTRGALPGLTALKNPYVATLSGSSISTFAEWALNIGPTLDGARCDDPSGDLGGTPTGNAAVELVTAISQAKLNFAGGSWGDLGAYRLMGGGKSVGGRLVGQFGYGLPKSGSGTPADGADEFEVDEIHTACQAAPVRHYRNVGTPDVPRPVDLEAPSPFNASAVPPGHRVPGFVNSGPPCDACEAAHQLVQAVGFACYGQTLGALPSGSTPPAITSADDLPAVEAWVQSTRYAAQAQVGGLYLESVPSRVVEDFFKNRVGTGSTVGAHGERVLQLEDELQVLASSWKSVTADLGVFGSALHGTRLAIYSGDIEKKIALLNLNIQQFRVYRDMLEQAGIVIASIATEEIPFASVLGASERAAVSITFDGLELGALSELRVSEDEKASAEVALALNSLQTVLGPTWADLEKNLGSIRSSVAELRITANQLGSLETKASYEAAKGTGADYFTTGGKSSIIPLNVVLRRQYDATARRYHEALKNAKYQAYLARRAIEQRIGQRLETIDIPIGALPAPSSWADDVCTIQGVDYVRLSSTDGIGPDADKASDRKIIDTFADQFIGDYVAKLASFVDYYNVEFPSHDGDDTAVISIKDDLLTATKYCPTDARNLLYYSNNLAAQTTSLAPEDHRWRLHGCASDGSCLRVLAGAALASPSGAPEIADHGGVTWLFVQSSTGADGGSTDSAVGDGSAAGADASAPPSPEPARIVSQSVVLTPGDYVLSWWDQARTADGLLSPSSGAAYPVGVYDTGWRLLAGDTLVPYLAPDPSSPWGVRRSFAFSVSTTATYYVGFGAALSGGTGSLAIANVQLEATPTGGAPSAYQATDATRAVVVGVCETKTSADLRAAFEYHCDSPGNCFYELSAPIIMDTGLLGTPTSSLQGKLARGNFNFRHIDVDLNLVGTGVRDCGATPTPSCYGSGFIEYTLNHDAHHAGILAWDNKVQFFDFGDAPIEHGKALAAERFITLPVGSADQGLLNQPGVTKPEFRGRPIDGSYRLRIWDSPALKWSRLDDIQMIFHYRYWSRINKSPSK